jgi:hypothetical protein
MRLALCLPLLALATACERSPGPIRTYTEHTVSQPPTRPAMGDPHAGLSPDAPAPAALAALDLQWDTPEGWVRRPGGGFRLATLEITTSAGVLECVISQLGPESGDPVGNVTRWVGQLGVTAPPESAVRDFCATLPSFTTAGGWPGRRVDLRSFAKDTSMLAAIVTLPDRVLFTRLTGPVAELDRLRPDFEALSTSLR